MIEQILLGLILLTVIFIAIMLYAIGEQIAESIKKWLKIDHIIIALCKLEKIQILLKYKVLLGLKQMI